MGSVDQRREHWGGAACKDVKAPTLTLPNKPGREKRHNRTTKAFACVVGSHANIGAGEARRW